MHLLFFLKFVSQLWGMEKETMNNKNGVQKFHFQFHQGGYWFDRVITYSAYKKYNSALIDSFINIKIFIFYKQNIMNIILTEGNTTGWNKSFL